MPLQKSGQISISDITSEIPTLAGNVSLYSLSTGKNLNLQSPLRPDGDAPHSISEFYGYDHWFTAGVDMSMYLANDIYNDSSYLEVAINGSLYYAYPSNPYPEYNILVTPESTVDMRIVANDGDFSNAIAADWYTDNGSGSAYGDYNVEINATFTAEPSEFELYVNAFSTGPASPGGGDPMEPVDPRVGR